MTRSELEIMQFIEEEDVKFIRLAFCDIFGVQKNISVQRSELSRAFEGGYPIDSSYLPGFGGAYGEDVYLHPEAGTATILPWRPEHGKVVRMFCTLTYADGSPVPMDTRALLKNAVTAAAERGYSFHFKSEMQFYLFKTDENGENTGIPYDNAGYMDIAPLDKGENVRREISLTLEQMGITPESSHHEAGPGQNEIDFRYADAMTAADDTVTFLSVVRTIAARNGLYADFSPKPIADKPGSALLINVSVTAKDGSDVSEYIISGLLDKIAEMTAFVNPHEESYQRFGRLRAPKYIEWSYRSRAQLVYTPHMADGRRCVQLRSPDPECNPYLTFALMIRAILDGIENRIELKPATEKSSVEMTAEELSRLPMLPQTVAKARTLAGSSAFIRSCLPDTVIKAYCQR